MVKINNNKTAKINKTKFDFALAGLLVIVLFILYVRIRLLSFPLERDEGEFAYMAQLILKGFPPYTLAFNFKFPGIYYMYALIISIFGQSAIAIHLGLMLINISTIIFIYFITKKLINSLTAFFASTTFAILSTSGSLLGQAAHATHFVTFFGIVGIYFLIQSIKSNKWYLFLLTGIFISLSVLMKQSFSFTLFTVVLILFNIFKKKKLKSTVINFLYFSLGFIIPMALTASIFLAYGNFSKFWFWTVTYAKEYGSRVPFSQIYLYFRTMFPMVIKDFIILWILFIIGIPFIFINKKIKEIKWALFLFTILSILSVFPGYYFRQHYFITLLPAVAIIIAILFDYLCSDLMPKIHQIKYFGISIFLIIIIISFYSHKDYFFKKTPNELCKKIYLGNPFVESVSISNYIKSNTDINDKIFIFGSEPQICFYSERISVTPYIYMYDLMYDNFFSISMQKNLIHDLEKGKPKILIFVYTNSSWLKTDKSNDYIFTKFTDFIYSGNYKLTGIIDNAGYMNTIYLWNDEALNYILPKSSTNYIKIYERAKDLNNVMNLGLNDVESCNNQGIAYGMAKQYDKAIEVFEKALKIAPQDEKVLYNLALAYKMSGKTDKAKEYFKKASEIQEKQGKVK